MLAFGRLQAVCVEFENVLFLVSYADDNKGFEVSKAFIRATFECFGQYK